MSRDLIIGVLLGLLVALAARAEPAQAGSDGWTNEYARRTTQALERIASRCQ